MAAIRVSAFRNINTIFNRCVRCGGWGFVCANTEVEKFEESICFLMTWMTWFVIFQVVSYGNFCLKTCVSAKLLISSQDIGNPWVKFTYMALLFLSAKVQSYQ